MGVGLQIRNYNRSIARMRYCRRKDSDRDILGQLEGAEEIQSWCECPHAPHSSFKYEDPSIDR